MLAGPDLKAVHPLGKSPVISVQVPGKPPLVIAESAAIVEYIVDYYAPHWIPKRYSAGQEAKIACETEEWLRYRQFMHYAEGSLMTLLIVTLVVNSRSSSNSAGVKASLNEHMQISATHQSRSSSNRLPGRLRVESMAHF